MTVVLVALGAAVGAPLRYATAHFLDGDGRLHWGTLLVNVAGSFLLGLLGGLSVDGATFSLLGTGFCGGLTTYSAFAVQVHDAGPKTGFRYAVLTSGLSLVACWWGFLVA